MTAPASDTLIIVPVYNEAAALPGVLDELAVFPELDVLVVDDASTDASLQVALASGVKVLPVRVKLGAWGAMQAGIRYACRRGYRFVITMDGDGQHHSAEIPNLIAAMESDPGADVVIGACLERGSRLRHAAWRYFRSLTGIGIEDITSGFRLYNRPAMLELARKEATLLDYQDVGVLLMLKSAGMRIKETPVTMTERVNGISRVFSSWFKVAYYMAVTTILSLSKAGSTARVERN